MEKRIDLERRGQRENQVVELNLDNCRSTSIVGLTDAYTALEKLSLINVGLTTLKGFPKLPNLKKLELSDNRISNGLNYLHSSPKLQYLNLSGNKIKDLEALKPLEGFKNLILLDLFNNEATQAENYREKIFEMVPSLRFLDGFDCNEVEAPSEADDEEENGNYSFEDDESTSTEDGLSEETVSSVHTDISLSEVYNDELEEDSENEWDEEGDDRVEEDDDFDEDINDDGDEEDESFAAAKADKEADGEENAEEPQARGKKRKHEG